MRLALVILALVALTGAAYAQPLGTIAVTPGSLAAPVPHDGEASLEASVTVECLLIVETQETSVAVTASSADGSIIGSSETIEIEPAACVSAESAGSVSRLVNLTLTPTAGAPGLVDIPVTVNASIGEASDAADVTVQVSYRPGHSVTPEITFPAQVEGKESTFDVTLEFFGNARTMIMFEDEDCKGCTVTGLQPLIRDPPATETIPLTFTAAAKDWDNATFSFRTFSHYLLESGDSGSPEMEKYITWEFQQAGGGGNGGDGEEESPSIGILLAVALAGLVIVARRRR